ncbi:MAG: alpha/beta fold hydrolase [Planctomycetia bacterium]|nr:alpha/beta fold hydrolase [Planctomycetia bacterium]
MVHVWYPAKHQTTDAPAPYIPGFSTIEAALGKKNLKAELGDFYEALSSARTHVVADADVSSDSTRYPVILLTHGLRYNALGYSTLGEDLASHGYVVVGVDHPATAFAVLFPDGQVTRFPESEWSQRHTAEETLAFERRFVDLCGADLVFVLNQLEQLASGEIPSRFQGRLDTARIGVFGHSFGGRVAARACQLDGRLKAGIVSDGFGRAMTVEKNFDGSTMDQPMMIQYARRVPRAGIEREMALRQTPGEDLEEVLRQPRQEFCESVKGGSYEVTFSTPGIIHESFSDLPLLESGQNAETMNDRQRTMAIVRIYTRAFFDRYLRERPAPELDRTPDNVSEVELTHHTFRAQ